MSKLNRFEIQFTINIMCGKLIIDPFYRDSLILLIRWYEVHYSTIYIHRLFIFQTIQMNFLIPKRAQTAMDANSTEDAMKQFKIRRVSGPRTIQYETLVLETGERRKHEYTKDQSEDEDEDHPSQGSSNRSLSDEDEEYESVQDDTEYQNRIDAL